MNKNINSIALLFFALLTFKSTFAWAQTPGTQWGAVSTASAGAGRAAAETSESPALNPAAIPFTRGYYATTDYTFLNQGYQFNVGLTDNLPDTVVPTSLIYNQLNGKTATNQDWNSQQGQLEFANFYNKDLSLGLGGRFRQDTFNNTQITQGNMLIGSLWTITPTIGVALTMDNLLHTDYTVPIDYRLAPSMSAGVNFNFHRLIRMKLDVTTASNDSWSSPLVAAGVESHLNRWTILRVGGSHAFETGFDAYAAGLGFTGPRFTVNVGYYNCPENNLLTRQAVDLAIPIW